MQTAVSNQGRFRKLPHHATHIVSPMILSLLMSGLVSAAATFGAVGFAPDLGARALGAWMLTYPIAFPAAIIAAPIVRRIVSLIVEAPPASRK
jgi:hypothetical protein